MQVMGPRTARDIIFHFVWTVAVAKILSTIDAHVFSIFILFNAGFVAVLAATRKEPLSVQKFTLWDEAMALIGVAALEHLL